MERREEDGRASSAVAWVSLGTAGVFEALTVLETQDKTIRAASPWQDDPYDVAVSLAQFAVPMLALVIALRLLAWRAPGSADRVRQTVRAAGALLALIGLTVVSEWAAVAVKAPASFAGGWTAALIGGLVADSVLTVVTAVLLVRYSRRHGSSGPWRHDWLGDAVFVCRRIPVLRHRAGPDAAAWVRRRAMTVFAVLSALAGAAVTGAQAVGEGWTDPLLTIWMLIVAATSYLAFCVISNAVAGFIARPPRSRPRRIAEASVVAGCVATSVATAFRGALWPLFGTGPLTSVPDLAALTLGAGLATSLATAVLLLALLPYDRSGPRRDRAGTAAARLRRPGTDR